MKNWMISLLAAAGLCIACQAQERIQVLEPQAYAEAVEKDTAAVVLDVRRPAEYEAGHLKNAVLLNYLDTEAFDAGLKTLDKSKTYYIYCRSGRRSNEAATKMQRMGFRVYDMKGGITAWEQADMPIIVTP